MGPFRHILVATDFSEASRRAFESAGELAAALGADLTVLHACEVPVPPDAGLAVPPGVDLLSAAEAEARRRLDELVASATARGWPCRAILRVGVPWQEILSVAAEALFDLVVMGTHGRRGIAHALMGSVAEKVVRASPVPVLTVRPAPP